MSSLLSGRNIKDIKKIPFVILLFLWENMFPVSIALCIVFHWMHLLLVTSIMPVTYSLCFSLLALLCTCTLAWMQTRTLCYWDMGGRCKWLAKVRTPWAYSQQRDQKHRVACRTMAWEVVLFQWQEIAIGLCIQMRNEGRETSEIARQPERDCQYCL